MGAFADFDAYITASRRIQNADFQTIGLSRALRLTALWPNFTPAPTVPTGSVALNDQSDIAISPLPATTGGLTLLGARVNPGGVSGVCLIVADILNQSGGLNGTLTTAQTTNLPTAALTRYTNGEGVMIGVILHAQNGSTATSVTASYTNQAGTPGRTTLATQVGGTGWREAGSLITLPFASGDTGARSVESVTFAATTGSNANAGVVMFRPLAMIALNDYQGAHVVDAVSSGGFVGALAQAQPGACLSLLAVQPATQVVSGSILVAEV